MRTILMVLTAVILVGAIGIGLAVFGDELPPPIGDGGGHDVDVVDIQRLNELATVQTTVSVPVTAKSKGWSLPGPLPGGVGKDSLILIAVGEVRAGVNLDKMKSRDVQIREEGKRVMIDLPEPEILSTSLNEDRTRVYDREWGFLSLQVPPDLETQARQRAVDKMERFARDDGILKQARRNAQDSIRAFVESLGYEEVEFAG